MNTAATPLEVYKDGEGEMFKGLVFAKFPDPDGASRGLKILRDKAAKANETKDGGMKRIWCDIEAPIENRVCMGYLRGLRGQLLEWNFAKECVAIDRERGIMKVAGKEVVKA